MDNGYIERIKKCKSEQKINNEMLSAMTGIPFGTLSKILAGISDSPRLSNMMAICDALGVSLQYIMTGEPVNHCNYLLEEDEIALMERYRSLDGYGRRMIGAVLEQECLRVQEQAAASGVASDKKRTKKSLLESAQPAEGKSAKVLPTVGAPVRKRELRLYDLPVSAGTGNLLSETSSVPISVPCDQRTAQADFALRVSGNSMEPRYHNGDVLLVVSGADVAQGELGIYLLDGDVFFKEFGGDCLISLNSSYKPIRLSDYESVRCLGKVVGKLRQVQVDKEAGK